MIFKKLFSYEFPVKIAIKCDVLRNYINSLRSRDARSCCCWCRWRKTRRLGWENRTKQSRRWITALRQRVINKAERVDRRERRNIDDLPSNIDKLRAVQRRQMLDTCRQPTRSQCTQRRHPLRRRCLLRLNNKLSYRQQIARHTK